MLAPVLFNLFFTCLLTHTVRDLDQGVYLRYRLDGSLFNVRHLRHLRQWFWNHYLPMTVLWWHTKSLQLIMDKFVEASCLFGLTISLGKTEVFLQPAPGTTALSPSISIEGTKLKTVEEFKYIESIISSKGLLDKEITARICKANQAIGYLHTWVPNQHNI